MHTHKAPIVVIGNLPAPRVPFGASFTPMQSLRKPHNQRNIRTMDSFLFALSQLAIFLLLGWAPLFLLIAFVERKRSHGN